MVTSDAPVRPASPQVSIIMGAGRLVLTLATRWADWSR